MKRIIIAGIAAAALLLVPQQPAETEAQSAAQLPPGPRTVHQSAIEIAMPSAPIEAVQMVLDFAPGAWTPPHSHGGDVLVTVLAGTMTLRGDEGERTYAAGETWTEKAGNVHAAGNKTNSTATVVVSFLMPKGGRLTILVQ